MSGAGYYKIEGSQLLYGEPLELPGGISLSPQNHSEYTYPIQGWTWFDSTELAHAGLNWSPPMDSMDVYWLDSIYSNLSWSAQQKVDRIKAEPQEFPE
jgi:hypothetical protein